MFPPSSCPCQHGTLKFKSPNACNHCHQDKGAAWADQKVRAWHKDDYQAKVLHRAGLIQAACQRDWSRLPDMLAYLSTKERDEVFTASLIRLLRACPHEIKWPAMLKAAEDPSPLVRAAAIASLQDWPSPQSAQVVFAALQDQRRLVCIRAAQALASYPRRGLAKAKADALKNRHPERCYDPCWPGRTPGTPTTTWAITTWSGACPGKPSIPTTWLAKWTPGR